jgi:hypothetical protein
VTTGRVSAAVGASTSAPAHSRKRTMLNPYAASNKQGAAGGYRIEQAEGVHTSISETASRAQWTYSEQSLPDQLFTPFPFSMPTSYEWYLGRTPHSPEQWGGDEYVDIVGEVATSRVDSAPPTPTPDTHAPPPGDGRAPPLRLKRWRRLWRLPQTTVALAWHKQWRLVTPASSPQMTTPAAPRFP